MPRTAPRRWRSFCRPSAYRQPQGPGGDRRTHRDRERSHPRDPSSSRPSDIQRGAQMKITGAQAAIKSLEQEGVEVMFGIPGGAILPFYDPILDSPIRHILCRHEQGAAHAADGYAQATGEPGVCVATRGHGVTHLVTGLASAYMDSIPGAAITRQVPP